MSRKALLQKRKRKMGNFQETWVVTRVVRNGQLYEMTSVARDKKWAVYKRYGRRE